MTGIQASVPEALLAIGARRSSSWHGREGVPPESVFVDLLIFPVSAERDAGRIALDIKDKLKAAYPGIHTIRPISPPTGRAA